MPVAIYAPELGLLHDAGPGHPESPTRLRAVLERVRAMPPSSVAWRDSAPASRAQVERVHDGAYLDQLESVRGNSFRFDADTAGNEHTIDAAYAAAGAACAMVSDLINGTARNGFALIRPPGHHAERDRAMGFCFLNTIAIAAESALHDHGVDRILIVDWDVHHGNGTQHTFESRDDVFFFSSHRGGEFYPGTGTADERGVSDGKGYTANVPLPAGCGDAVMLGVYERILPELCQWFRKDLVLISAGFDAHIDDPLGGLRMTTDGYGRLCALIATCADKFSTCPVGLILEGGYHPGALSASVERCIEVLNGGPTGRQIPEPTATECELIERLSHVLLP